MYGEKDGYMEDAQGRLVPVDQIKEIDRERHDLVMEKVGKVKAMRDALVKLKGELLGDFGAFVAMSAEKYEVKLGGNKGNVTFISFDGRYKIVRQMAEYITFDERLQAAKSLVDECLRDWTTGARSEVRALIDQAFQVDKEGSVNTGRILALRRLNIDDERWQRAMQAIGDAIQVTGTKAYVRVYERNEQGGYTAIPLDMAAL